MLKYTLTMEWQDHRLEYHNLKMGLSVNILDVYEVQKIWTPSLVFENTEDREVTSLSFKSQVEVRIMGNVNSSKIDVADEINISKGEENPFLWTEIYLKSLKCVFDLEMFPFDIQVTQRTKEHSNYIYNTAGLQSSYEYKTTRHGHYQSSQYLCQ